MVQVILSQAFGGIYGGYPLILTGEAFGATQGAVTIEGRACEIVSWSNSTVVVTLTGHGLKDSDTGLANAPSPIACEAKTDAVLKAIGI